MNLSEVRVLILGSKGQLGTELQRSFRNSGQILACDRNEVDVADDRSVRAVLSDFRPGLILNASAYTAVDRAETEPELAMRINGYAPGLLAEEARRTSAVFVHYSTDYVFDGTKTSPYTEDDEPNPLNVYGRTKLAGERAVAHVGGRYLIFRTSWVYGPHGNNFLRTVLRLAHEEPELRVVSDQIGAPTSSVALADATYAVIASNTLDDRITSPDWAGLYHMTCAGETSWHGFARAILAGPIAQSSVRLQAISTQEYPLAAARPNNSVLSNQKLAKAFGISLPDWTTALHAVFELLQARSHA